MLKSYKFSILWALLIVVLSVLPGSQFPKTHITNLDLLVHFFFYSTFHFLLLAERFCETQKKMETQEFTVTFLIALSFGGGIELVQGTEWVSRSAEVSDFLANTFGAVIGWVIFKLSYSPLKKLCYGTKKAPRKRPES